MANIHIRTLHNLAHEDALSRVEAIALDLKKTMEANYSWRGKSLYFQRNGASGSIDVGKESIEFKIKLGLMLSPMKGAIEKALRRKIQNELG